MKKTLSVLLLAVLLAAVTLGSASADVITTSGTVVSIRTETITASLGGSIGNVLVSAGDHVSKGDTLVTLDTQKVYALQGGTVRVFGEVGDTTDMLVERYGAVVYVEPECEYVVAASTRNAFDAEANKVIHPGETVYMRSVDNIKITGTGIVTSVADSSYSIEVTSGSFSSNEGVYIYRKSSFVSTSRIGRGTVSHQSPVAYTGTGIVVNYPVANGKKVKKGAVLFETLEGAYKSKTGNWDNITASSSGVIASISINKGGKLAAGDVVADFYADGDMRIEATVTETDLHYFKVGDTVTATFTYLDNGEYKVSGKVEKISAIGAAADEETNEASYSVLIKPGKTDRLYYGMNAVIEKEVALTAE